MNNAAADCTVKKLYPAKCRELFMDMSDVCSNQKMSKRGKTATYNFSRN